MKTAVVVPTLNAVKRGFWYELLRAIAEQRLKIDLKLVVDSESSDQTVDLASALGWKCLRHHRRDFNHGGTRARIVRYLASKGFDTVIFLSQDVVLSEPDTLKKLTDYLWKHPEISGCCGKQISLHEKTLNAWQRERCYPNVSRVRTAADIPRDGMMAAFFSNAFAAWKVQDLIRFGNFPETDFGEDMLLASRILENGGATGYCAEAIAIHEHSNAPFELFRRGWQIGSFHRLNPDLLKRFRNSSVRIARKNIPAAIVVPLAVKAAGYCAARFRDLVIPAVLFFLLWLLLLPCILLEDYPLPDVAMRYAPMAEAFARGDWLFAFHPRITPLLPVSAGVIAAVLRCGGFLACKLAASLFLSLSIFPLYAGTRRLFGRPIAACASFLFIVCPYLLRFGYYGSRESCTIFGILLCFYAAVRLSETPRKFAPWAWFSLGETVILLSRGDMALFAAFLFAGLFVWDFIRFRIPFRSILAGFAVLLLLAPLLCCNRRLTGYPVLDTRHAAVFNLVSKRIPPLKHLVYSDPVMPVDLVMSTVETAPAGIAGQAEADAPQLAPAPAEQPKPRTEVFHEFLHTIWGGIFPFFLFFAVIGIAGRIRRRQWTGFDTLLILTFLVFELLAAFQVCLFYGLLATSRRYLFIGIPLYLPFAALGFRDFWRILWNLKFGKSVAVFLAVLLCAAFFYKLYSPIFTELAHDSVKGMERDLQLAAAEWIRSDWSALPASQEPPLRVLKCDQYQSGKRPLVDTGSYWLRLGFFAEGQDFPEFLRGSDTLPDYIVVPADALAETGFDDAGIEKALRYLAVPGAYREVHADAVDGIRYFIFRNTAL